MPRFISSLAKAAVVPLPRSPVNARKLPDSSDLDPSQRPFSPIDTCGNQVTVTLRAFME
jgi:hypothetical protein